MSSNVRSKDFSIESLDKYSSAPIKLFRGIELKILLSKLKKIVLSNPGLDLGCGDGFICSLVFGCRLTYGLDNNELGDVKVAKKNKIYDKILIESAENISLPNGSVNFVFSNSVIEHIPRNNLVLNEISRILKPGGYFIFTSPSHYFTKYLVKHYGKTYTSLRNKQFNHFHLLSHSQWQKRLKKSGISLRKHFYYMSEPDLLLWEKMLWKSKINSLIPFLFRDVKNKELIKKIIINAKANKSSGANVLIISQKK